LPVRASLPVVSVAGVLQRVEEAAGRAGDKIEGDVKMAMLTTDEVIAGLEKQIQRKEREIAYTKKWIQKLRGQTTSEER